MNCPTCSRPLEPATLNKKNLWCSVCAVEYNPSGGPVVRKPAATMADQIIPEAGFPSQVPPDAPIISMSANVDDKSPAPRFRVRIGAVSFVAHGHAELDIAGTKVVITAL